MSDELLNLIRREIALYLTTRASTRIGIVQSYDPSTHSAKVEYQPEGVLSGWIPVGTGSAGGGWGMGWAPMVDQQVMVHFLEGTHDSGIIGPSLHSTADQPPAGIAAGMMWLIDPAGSSIKLTNDGNVSITMPGNLSVSVGGNLEAAVTGNITTSAAAWNHTGNLAVTGAITATEDIKAGPNAISLENHVHIDVQPGSGESGPPQT